jgi:hypothetical protein
LAGFRGCLGRYGLVRTLRGTNIKQATEKLSRRLEQILTLLGV